MVWGFVTCGPNEALVVSGNAPRLLSCFYHDSCVTETHYHGAMFTMRKGNDEIL